MENDLFLNNPDQLPVLHSNPICCIHCPSKPEGGADNSKEGWKGDYQSQAEVGHESAWYPPKVPKGQGRPVDQVPASKGALVLGPGFREWRRGLGSSIWLPEYSLSLLLRHIFTAKQTHVKVKSISYRVNWTQHLIFNMFPFLATPCYIQKSSNSCWDVWRRVQKSNCPHNSPSLLYIHPYPNILCTILHIYSYLYHMIIWM